MVRGRLRHTECAYYGAQRQPRLIFGSLGRTHMTAKRVTIHRDPAEQRSMPVRSNGAVII